MKKALALALGVLMFVAVFAGCGGGGTTTAPTTTGGTTTGAATTAATTGATTTAASGGSELSGEIDMLLWWSTNPEQIEGLVEQYETDRPGVKVNLTFMVGAGVEENLEVRIASNKMPELTSGGVGSWYYDVADKGYLGDVSSTEAWQKQIPAMQQGWTSPGGVKFGVAYGVAYMYCYYNEEMFAEAGITKVPESWDEWMEVCQKLQDAGFTPIAMPGSSSNNIGHNVFSGACAGVVSTADPSISTAATLMYTNYDFNNANFIKAYQRAKDWANSGYIAEGFMSADYDSCVRAFANKEVAMCIEGSWSVANYLNDEEFDFTPNTFIPPYNDAGQPLYGTTCSETGFSIGATPNVNQELALDIFNYFAYEKFADRQRLTGVVPPFAADDIIGEISLHPASASCSNDIASKPNAGPLMFTVMLNDVYSRATELTQEVMMGQMEPEEAVLVLNELQSAHFN